MPRRPVTSELLQAMGSQLSDVEVSPDKAQAQAAAFDALMDVIAELRSLPLKDVEPAVIYAPDEARR